MGRLVPILPTNILRNVGTAKIGLEFILKGHIEYNLSLVFPEITYKIPGK